MLAVHTWRITGVSPLLQSNPEKTMGGSGDDGLKAKKKVYDDNEEAANRVYKDGNHFIHPTSAFRSVILEAAKGRKIGKTAARTILSGSVFPVEQHVILLDAATGKPFKKYEQHKCRVVVNKAGVLRVRPMFPKWSCMLALEVDTDFIPTDKLHIVTEILNIGGRIIGVGEFRPDTSKGKSGVGTFGRFSAELVN
jgi:hypothetical protein